MKLKWFTKFPVLTALLLLCSISVVAQTAGDVRSAAEGNWSAAATWEVYSGAEWAAAVAAPDGSENIALTHIVTVDVPVTVTGNVTAGVDGQLSVGDGTLAFGDGSIYDHARDGGSFPLATWNTGSTMIISGVAGAAPGNRNQNFHNLVFNTPANSGNKDMGFSDITIGGDITVESTGSARWQLSSGGSGTTRNFSIMGDVVVNDGQFAVQGTGNGDTHFNVNHHGNVVVNGGNFSLSRGSQGGTGTTTWNLLGGNVTLNTGTSQNSNGAGAKFVFAGDVGVQNFEVSATYTVNGTGINSEVSSGASVNLGESDVRDSGFFTLNSGATLYSGHANGLIGNITTSGTVSLSEMASYGFNGSVAQATSSTLPTTVANLIIDNTAGVTLSQATTVNAQLQLKAGVFDNTVPFTLGPVGEIIEEGGSLLVPVSSGIEYAEGDFKAVASGNWSDVASWNVYTSGAFAAATSAPTGSEFILIDGSSVITTDIEVTISGKVLVTEDGRLTAGESSPITFADGSEYEHGRDGGTLPTATWGAGSTFNLTGTVGANPNNRSQNFYNMIINTPESTANRHFDFNGAVIGGNIDVYATGAGANRWQLTSAGVGTTRTITIMGDVTVHGGQFATHGSGNGDTQYIVNHHGNIVVNGGNFSIARSNQSNTGTTVWNLLGGNMTLNAGTSQNSNAAGAKFVFAGTDVQNVEVSASYDVSGAALAMEIAEDAIVRLGSSVISGSGNFTLLAGGEVQTAHTDGLAGNLTTTGTVTLSEAANYTFNGTALQATSSMLPTVVNNLNINNTVRVTLSQQTQINGVLALNAGIFDNTIDFTLGPDGSVVTNGGQLFVTPIAYVDGDVRTVASGNWTDGAIWESLSGGTWTALTGAPAADAKVFVRADHVVTVDADATITGRVNVVHSAQLTVAEGVTLTFGNGGVYNHGRNEGILPTAVWAEGSTYLVTGTSSTAPGNRNQNFHNIEINTTLLAANVDLGLNGVTVGGNILIRATSSGRWHMSTASPGDSVVVTIMGDVTHLNGNFTVNGTGAAGSHFIVHHYGNIHATLGNFSISRGSQGGTGTTTWYLYGGNFTMIANAAQNSNNLGAKWVFAGDDGVQVMDVRSTATIQGKALNTNILEGASLNLGNSNIRGTADFNLLAGAELKTTSTQGLEGNFTTTGTVSLSQEGSFAFVGNAFQETGFNMPQTVQNLTIDNGQGVAMSRETTVNGTLLLKNGMLDNTATLTLGVDGQVVIENGELLFPLTGSSIGGIDEVPTVFALKQNFPNPFNPTTQIKYDIPSNTNVTLDIYDVTGRLVASLVNGQHAPGSYSVTWNAHQYASGMYIYRIRAGEFTSTKQLMLIK